MLEESIEQLILKARECLENNNLNDAMELGKAILAKDADDSKGLEIMGYILLEMNCHNEAKFCFTRSIENMSIKSHVPYLYLGQLTEGEESEKYFLEAVVIMLSNIDNEDKHMLFRPTKLDVSNTLVSLSELYMTDLCDKEDAEQKCKEFIQRAIDTDEKNPASWQSLASLNLVKNEVDDAKINIKKSIDLWLPESLKVMSDTPMDESQNEIITTCDLSAELRIKCTEILFELGMLVDARKVLDTILIEDSEFFQAHYLMALVLEAMLVDDTTDNKDDLLDLIEEHAEIAISLADPDLESEAVAKMEEVLEKIGINREDEDMESGSNCDDSGEDLSDDKE